MPNNKLDTVPNQRVITVNKEKCDKQHLFTVNNIDALSEAARRLQSKGGFKLYMYLAKHQDKYHFALSSFDFMLWSGLGATAYTTAFNELKEQGYLIPKDHKNNKETIYTFYDKSQKPEEEIPDILIEYPEDTVKEIKEVKKDFIF